MKPPLVDTVDVWCRLYIGILPFIFRAKGVDQRWIDDLVKDDEAVPIEALRDCWFHSFGAFLCRTSARVEYLRETPAHV